MMRNALLMMATMAVAGTGCDDAAGPAAGQGEARVAVTVRGDSPSGANGYRAADGSGEAAGEARIDVAARVWLQTEAGRWVEVTRGTARATVEADGGDGGERLAENQVEARGYTRVRVEFERVEANSESGIQVGLGLLTGSVRVELGSDGRTVVEREMAVEARQDSEVRLEIDLNSDQWLRRADASTRAVAEGEFQGAVRVTGRGE